MLFRSQKQRLLNLRTTAILAMILISFPLYIGFIILLRSYVYAYSLLLTIFRSHSGTGDSGRGTIAAGVADSEFLPP